MNSALFMSKEIENCEGGELRAANQVAMPEAPWFLGQAEQPFQAVVAHPRWGATHSAGMKVEGGADADKNRRGELVLVIKHPALLLGSAEAYPDDVWIRLVDYRANFSVLVGR